MFDIDDTLDTPTGKNASVQDLEGPKKSTDASKDDVARHRHTILMELLTYEGERQAEERQQAQYDEDYYDHLQWRPEDARALIERGQAPLVFNQARQTIDWIAGTEKRMRKDYKILPREPNDEQGADLKTKLVKYTDDANLTQWHRSKAFKQAVTAGLSWLEEGINPDPEAELIYAGMEDWRNVFRDSHSRNLDLNVDGRYLFRRRIIDLDYAVALLPKHKEHLKAMAGKTGDDQGGDVWYLGEKLTGASETEWGAGRDMASFGARAAYMGREGYFDSSRRKSVELLECWYKVPSLVPVFAQGQLTGRAVNQNDPSHAQAMQQGAQTYNAVKMRMRVMICTTDAPMEDAPSPFRHNRFLLVPVWGYRRARDGMTYGSMRGMRDIQDDLNKRRSKALFALSSNRMTMEENAVDDYEEARLEAARPDMMLIIKPGKKVTFEKPMNDFQGNMEMAEQDSQLLRDVGGVTNENLGRDTRAISGIAIQRKQDQGSITTSELFDNYLMAINQAGRLRLSHIEQFWTEEKAVRIVGERRPIEWLEINKFDPATGQILNDVTAREADFIVDTQDYRTTLAQGQLDQLFELLGKIAQFAPQVVMNVLDLVVETADIKDKEEWVSRIRKLNGQRDPSKPPTPEEQATEKATIDKQMKAEAMQEKAVEAGVDEILAKISKLKSETEKLDTGAVLARVESMFAALQAAQIVATIPQVTPVADEIAASAGLQDMHQGDIPVPAQMQQVDATPPPPQEMPPQVAPGAPQEPTQTAPTGPDGAPLIDPTTPDPQVQAPPDQPMPPV